MADYGSIIRRHLDWLDDGETLNATRVRDGVTFQFTRGSHSHTAEETEAGTLVALGATLTGYVRTTEITLAPEDVVTLDGSRWRVTDLGAITRVRGASVVAQTVFLSSLE